MKKQFTILLILVFSVLQAQHAIKVYVTDAITGKNVKKAKVTLESFEIPEIVGKYNRKEKCYYFDTIPAGYNTVMAYHKKYNEKGFQKVDGLPMELKLGLKSKKNNFLMLPDTLFSEEKKELVRRFNYKEYYIEDPYKIVIDIDSKMNYEDKKLYLSNLIKDQNIEVEMINPFYEKDKMNYSVDYNVLNTCIKSQDEAYPSTLAYDSKGIKYFQLLPLLSGLNTIDVLFLNKNYSDISKEVCFILRKKDKLKFKRFNDPIIKKLKESNLNICSIVLYKRSENIEPILFTKNKIRDKLNNEFNLKYKIDSSKVFFYDNRIRNKSKREIKKENSKQTIIEPSDPNKIPYFILIKNDKYYISNGYLKELNEETFYQSREEQIEFIKYNVNMKIPIQENSIGLGLLDQYEYYSNKK